MEEPRPRTFYYLFPEGGDFAILRITDERAAELWEQGKPFVGVGVKTRAEAEAFRAARLGIQPGATWINESHPHRTSDSAAQSSPDNVRSA